MPWLLLLTVVLAALVAVFGPVEARTRRAGPHRAGRAGGWPAAAHRRSPSPATPRVVAALLVNSPTPQGRRPEPLGTARPGAGGVPGRGGPLRLLVPPTA